MSTIGFDQLYYAPITENTSGEETYGTTKNEAYKTIQGSISAKTSSKVYGTVSRMSRAG